MNWLEQIGCYFLSAVAWLLTGIVYVIDQFIAAIAAIASTAIALLPDFPTTPETPASVIDGARAVNWIVPVGTLLAVLASCVTLWMLWLFVSSALRWVRAVE